MIRNYFIEKIMAQPLIALCSGDTYMSESATYLKGINVIMSKPVDFEKLGKVLRVMDYIGETENKYQTNLSLKF
mgnify:FL=1